MSTTEIKSKIAAAADQLDEARALQLLAFAQDLLKNTPSPHAAFLRHAGLIEPADLSLMQQAINADSKVDSHEW
ncbi:MAG TPA: hypothetical protein VFO93_07925 [Hymenobacter sp.]|uniref:hypothetical protein n=1 Tax=Hymenobacter sp. TaxID=1898978 RepID=UPI002D808B23|nr:hypothetical protein [Hymenobacter sp.]HET9503453.1 hypothetical protein [Hymenobacter sp.]